MKRLIPSEPFIVVVDDERTFKTDTSIVYLRDSKSALAFLARKMMYQQSEYGWPIDELWLDHDLGHPDGYPDGTHDTIRPVVNFLDMIAQTQFKLVINKIFIHSQNQSGVDHILPTLLKHYSVMRVPLPELIY